MIPKEEKLRIFAMYLGKTCKVRGESGIFVMQGMDWVKDRIIVGKRGIDVDNVVPLLRPNDDKLPERFFSTIVALENKFGMVKPYTIKKHLKRIAEITRYAAEEGVDIFGLIEEGIAEDITKINYDGSKPEEEAEVENFNTYQ